MATSRIADHVGRVLGGRYRLLAPIGTGASAHVFLADDVTLRRRVAVKVLHAALADDPAFLRRFRAEAQAAAALNHPHIMRVFDWGEDHDGPYLVLEYLGGGSLRDMLDAGHRLTVEQAVLAGLEAARALDYAHRRGLVHRDIKPANLLFDEEGRLCIADFGLARALAEAAWTEPAGAMLGTARYASPEQAQGSSVDGKADVYALGLALVEAITGSVPFAADTTIATLMARVGARFEAPAELGPLGPVAEGMLAPEADDRPDAGSLLQALDDVVRQLPAPRALPLVGARPMDATRVIERADDTQLGVRRPGPPLFDREAHPEEGDAGRPDAPTVAVPVAAEAAAGEQDASQPRRRRRWPLVLVAVVLLAAAIAGGAFAVREATTPSHPVPRLVDLTLDQARAAVADERFEIRVAGREFHETVPEGVILQQDPLKDAELKEGRTIAVVVSKGPAPREVPDLSGLDEAAAVAALEERGFTPKVGGEHREDVAKGQVLDWSPKGVQPKGTEVQVLVSRGPEPRRLSDWKGKPFEEAKAAMEKAGLKVQRKDVYSDEVGVGLVVSTSPGAGQTVEKGGTVTVNVSIGPETITVPDLGGRTVDEARAALEQVGLKLGAVYGPPNARRVIFSVPGAGAKVKRGTPVDVYTR